MRRALTFLMIFLLLPLPAAGHTESEKSEWLADWYQRVETEVALTVELVAEYQTFAGRHQPIVLPTERRYRGIGTGVEQWRSLVATYFPAEQVEAALRVMACESGGNPDAKNPTSSASGLFQHLASYWPDRSTRAGWGGADIFNPEANVAVAAWLQAWGGWGHWVCPAY